mmetsp:Transcript_18732/g.38364  ORF Transcript_18732/g.38364 Transcript_18732/m.38364 type:complete len:194 (-) Transcript_18732:106-687(-)
MQPHGTSIVLSMLLTLMLIVPATMSLGLSRPQFLRTITIATTTAASPPLPSATTFIEDPRGFAYSVLTPPTSELRPVRGQTVKCDYTLTLQSFEGPQIDSSRGFLGSPLSFPVGVGQVIKGWDFAVRDMGPGERRLLVVPASLGYGEKEVGSPLKKIPANSTLYFDVTLVDIGAVPNFDQKQRDWLEAHPEES